MNLKRRSLIGMMAGGIAGIIRPDLVFAEASTTASYPKPTGYKRVTLLDALKLRKSSRTYSERPLSEESLSNLLWAAYGINRPGLKLRTAPSALNWQEIGIYVVKADGVFIFEPIDHGLKQVSTKDIRGLTGRQKFVETAPVNLVFVADFSKTGGVRDDQTELLSAANTGFISQNVYLYCAAEGLATVVRNYIDRPTLAKALKLNPDQQIILAQTVGYPKE